ncbi:MAG: hypothetical protein ACRDJU_00960, partial [Actinomycetota bacterium]
VVCWAAADQYVARVAGVVFNEIRLASPDAGSVHPPEFRRTRVRKRPKELRQLRRQAAQEFLEMVDPAVVPYPAPSPANCGPCPFRAPCLAMSAGEDLEPVLAGGYRTKVPYTIPLPERTGSLGPQRVIGWKTAGPGPSSLDDIPTGSPLPARPDPIAPGGQAGRQAAVAKGDAVRAASDGWCRSGGRCR